MSVGYDGRILTEFATRLYSQARTVIVSYTITGVLLGALIGGGGALALSRQDQTITVAAIMALIFGAIGYNRGRERAFALKLQAQMALCQAQIEVNTRSP